MKALITGASGFIGSRLIQYLSQNLSQKDMESAIVPVALLRATSNLDNLKGCTYEVAQGDLRDLEALKRAVASVDIVFHLAGVTKAKNRQEYLAHNADGTENVAKAILEANPKIKRLVYVSSLAAGGPSLTESPRVETDPESPVSAYGESKLEGEARLKSYFNQIPVTIIRPPLVYGPRDKDTLLFFQAAKNRLVPIFKARASHDGQKHYSHIHVDDLCAGIVKSVLVDPRTLSSGEVFYLSSDQTISFRELMRTIAQSMGVRTYEIPMSTRALQVGALALQGLGKVTGKTYPLNLDKYHEILPDYWTCANTKAKERLGFSPKHDFASGIEDTLKWYREHSWL